MTSSKIEQLLFRGKGEHHVIGFAYTPSQLLLTVAPFLGVTDEISAKFTEFTINASEIYEDPEDLQDLIGLNLPWNIISFDCYEVDSFDSVKWSFILHCDSMKIWFVSKWPQLIRTEYTFIGEQQILGNFQ